MALPANELTHIVWPREGPVDEGRTAPVIPPEYVDGLEARITHPLAQVAAELRAIRQLLEPTGGRPFSLLNGATADGSGNGLVIYDGPRSGNVWRVEGVVVSVTGASAAASLAAYVDTVDEGNLGGFLAALSGNSPSRGFLALDPPVVVFGGYPVVVAVRGAVAGAQITCRIQGRNETIGD